METNMPVNIRPIQRPSAPSGTEGVGRRGDGGSSSAFSPRTNVAIQTAIDDMAGILSKISSSQDETMEKMPEDLQKVVQNVLKQAFSMNETLSQGIGSTLESQRFSMEQLTALSRMLNQLGNLVEKGYSADFGDDLQALLKNLKNFLTTNEGNSLEPVLLNKAAFQLLDTKTLQDLPEVLQQLVAQMQFMGSTPQMAAQDGESSSLGFLKQLVQYFMPKPGGEEGESTGYLPRQNAQGETQSAPGQQTGAQQSGTPSQTQGQPSGNASQAQGQPTGNANQAQGQQANASGQLQGQSAGNGAQASGQQSGTPAQGNAAASQQGAAQPQAQGNTAGSQQGAAQPQAQGNTAGSQQGTAQPQAQGNTAATQQGTAQPQAQGNAQGRASQGGMAQNAQNAPAQGGNTANPSTAPQGSAGEASQQTAGNQGNQAAPEGNAAFSSANRSQQGQPMQGQESQGKSMGNRQQDGQEGTLRENVQNRFQQGSQQEIVRPTKAQQARTQLVRVPLQNTPQTMETMKGVAQFLLRNAEMTEQDTALLQNFVNGRESVMSEREARQLQNLLRLCQQNVPTTVQQAAVQQDLPDLPRLWAFMQLCDMAVAKRMNSRQLKKAGKDVADLVMSMRHSMTGSNSSVPGQKSLNFMLPLFLGENEKSYPSYIHVYDENAQDPYTGEMKKETWLRLCVLTDNIGAVELTCRIFDNQQLDMRLFFSSHETAEEFREYVPEFREFMRDSKELMLNEVKVGAVGER
ncbi:MAG: hypothetical protein IIZ54_12075, partial [Selenomonadaceae bacterium]|nr:hypothetical protein [Selenomonadaceae bacterium]